MRQNQRKNKYKSLTMMKEFFITTHFATNKYDSTILGQGHGCLLK